jgi:FKBP-type peptidyl-prolyl cis-trans isomerase FklB
MKLIIALFLLMILPLSAVAQLSLAEQGRAFLEENQHQEGVVVTKSGLQYKVLQAGNDKKPRKRSEVTVHFIGRHIDDTMFDRSFSGKPVTMKLSRAIKGWKEGLQLVGEGGRIILYVPSRLAYGRDGAPPAVGRNETLVFTIDLIEVHD